VQEMNTYKKVHQSEMTP